MAIKKSRDDFSNTVKRLLAQRAGYICSFPNCNKITSFPSITENEKAINNGVASHITAAAPNGPRYDSRLSEEERSSFSNGIWLCTEHSFLIDKDYSSYSAEELREWKKIHEEEVLNRAKLGITLRNRLKKITIIDFGQMKGTHTFNVYKNSIFYSPKPIGKSMIFDLMSALFGLKHENRWYKKFNKPVSISKFLFLIDSNELEYEFKIFSTNNIQFELNGQKIFKPNSKFNMIYLTNDNRFSNDFEADVKSALNIEKRVLSSLIDYINGNEKFFIKGIKLKNEDVYVLFREDYISYDNLCSSEKERLFLEIAIQLAKKNSLEAGTILVLDKTSFLTLDRENYQEMIDKLVSDENNFQVVITTNEINPFINYKNFVIIDIK